MNDEREKYLDDRDRRADAAILGASGYLDLARGVRERHPDAFRDQEWR